MKEGGIGWWRRREGIECWKRRGGIGWWREGYIGGGGEGEGYVVEEEGRDRVLEGRGGIGGGGE